MLNSKQFSLFAQALAGSWAAGLLLIALELLFYLVDPNTSVFDSTFLITPLLFFAPAILVGAFIAFAVLALLFSESKNNQKSIIRKIRFRLGGPWGSGLLLGACISCATVDHFVYPRLYPIPHLLLSIASAALALAWGVHKVVAGGKLFEKVRRGVGLSLLTLALALVGPWLGGQLWQDKIALRQSVVMHTRWIGRLSSAYLKPVDRQWEKSECQHETRRVKEKGELQGFSLLLLTVDAFRHELGGQRFAQTFPKSSAILGKNFLQFHSAYAPAPRTVYSVYSLLTGMFPHKLGFETATLDSEDVFHPLAPGHPILLDPRKWKLVHRYPLNDKTPTLAGLLRQFKYQTAAVIADASLAPAGGITREFEQVDDGPYQQNGRRDLGGITSEYTADALNSILTSFESDSSRPYFVWSHFRDPHYPYTALPPVPEQADPQVRYWSEFRRVDEAMASVFEKLKKSGQLEKTIVIITGDHGEEFGDHGGKWHGTSLYEELIHVPLRIYFPDAVTIAEDARAIQTPVSLTDITPTVLDWLGVSATQSFDGRSLAELFDLRTSRPVDERESRPIFAYNTTYEAHPKRRASVRLGDLKLIENEDPQTLELFDLENDPGEQENLADRLPEEREKLRCLLHGTGVFEGSP